MSERAAKITQYLYNEVPLSKAMGIKLIKIDDSEVVLGAPLAPNRNHQGTLFGGSAASIATLACWTLVHDRMMREPVTANLVVQKAQIEYLRPCPNEVRAVACLNSPDQWLSAVDAFNRKGKARMSLKSSLYCEQTQVVRFSGDFVFFR
ncbi:MAG: YiiD C-terminal domain-containing protein [Pseudomonadota bacterium]